MKISGGQLAILSLIPLCLSACNASNAQHAGNAGTITVVTVRSKAVTSTEQYLCRINSRRSADVRAPESAILEAIEVREGQAVEQNDLLFRLRPPPDQTQRDAKNQRQDVSITAPIDGLVGRLPDSQGSLVHKGESLTTLFDNRQMSVYFDAPKDRFRHRNSANPKQHEDAFKIELILANGKKFNHSGKLNAILAGSKPGDMEYRADFPNPDRLLRDGQTGSVLISSVQNGVIAIPQRATFQLHDKRYVWVVGKDGVAHGRKIVVQNESDDSFVVHSGLADGETIVVDGIRQVRDGDKVR